MAKMSKLEELIKELCPNGVEFKALEDVIDYEQPSKYIVKNTDYSDRFPTPVLTAGQTFILGYTNEEDGIYEANKEKPVIIFDDFTTANKWVDFRFKIKSSAMKILTSKDNNKYDIRYLYHVIQTIRYVPVDHSRQWIGTYSKFTIPVPHPDVQCEIVRILDNFTELTAELTARKKQYEYYRDQLLTFDESVPSVKLGNICDVITGGEVPGECVKGNIPSDDYTYPIWGNGKNIYGYTKSYKVGVDAVCISSIGANTGMVYFHKANFTPIVRLKVLIPKNNTINTRYLFHAVSTIKFEAKKSSVPNMSAGDIKKLSISLPSSKEQERIVSILDRFDALCNDISVGLPAEIEARKKQYEYYRDKLLTFKNIDSEAN